VRAFGDYNPAVIFVYFMAAAGCAMFSMNPVLLALSLAGAFLYCLCREGGRCAKPCLFFAAVILASAAINPFFNHNGVTVLFVMNNNPVTLEAVLYGAAAGGAIASSLMWFRSFSALMTSDRILYLLGGISPKLALLVSMTLRYIPLFGVQYKKTSDAQRALGLYSDADIPDAIRGGTRVFSVMVTWALENGIVTADSMEARGYGIGRRTNFALCRFRRSDGILLILILVMLGITAAGSLAGALGFAYYPAVKSVTATVMGLLSYISYAALALLPSAMSLCEEIKWRYLKSKI